MENDYMESLIKLIAGMSEAGQFGSSFIVLLFFVGVGFGIYLSITKIAVWAKLLGFTTGSAASTPSTQENIIGALNKAADKSDIQAKENAKELELQLDKMSESVAKLLHYNSNMHDNVDKMKASIEELRQRGTGDQQVLFSLRRELESITTDSKSQYVEINRQFQQIQRDIATLHGTFLAMNSSDRTKLK